MVLTLEGANMEIKPAQQHAFGVLFAVVALVASMFAAVAISTPPAAAATDVRLVTVSATHTAGWVLADGNKQWLTPDCRAAMEAAGLSFEIVPWAEISSLVEPSPLLRCDEALNLARGIEPQPGALSFVTNTTANPAGWVIINGTKQWVSPDCRGVLEGADATFIVTRWATFGQLPAPDRQFSCLELASLWTADGPGRIAQTPGNTDSAFYLTVTTRQWINQACLAELVAAGVSIETLAWSEIQQWPATIVTAGCDQILADVAPVAPPSCTTYLTDDRQISSSARYEHSWDTIVRDPITGEPNFVPNEADENANETSEPPAGGSFADSYSGSALSSVNEGAVSSRVDLTSTQGSNGGQVQAELRADSVFAGQPDLSGPVRNPGESASSAQLTYGAEFQTTTNCTFTITGNLAQNTSSWDVYGGRVVAQQQVSLEQQVGGVWEPVTVQRIPDYAGRDAAPAITNDGANWVRTVDVSLDLAPGTYRLMVTASAGESYEYGRPDLGAAALALTLSWSSTPT